MIDMGRIRLKTKRKSNYNNRIKERKGKMKIRRNIGKENKERIREGK